MFKRKCKITFISHGATVHTMDGIICDTEKYPKINEFGEEEIEKVCEYLENRAVTYDKIYTSSSARCTQSAQTHQKHPNMNARSIHRGFLQEGQLMLFLF